MPETDRRQAFQTAKRICTMVESLTVDARGEIIRFTVSIGVSGTWISKHPDLEALLLDGDKALYKAKENGRNQAVLLN